MLTDYPQKNNIYFVSQGGSASLFCPGIWQAFNGLQDIGRFNPVNGYYYGIDRTPYWDDTGYNIVVIDIATQTIVRTIPTVDRLHTLVFVGGSALPVPDLSRAGMLLMVLFLAGAAIVEVRRFS